MILRAHGAEPSAPAARSRWYERELGWPTAAAIPSNCSRGWPSTSSNCSAVAGFAMLRRVPRTGPVAVEGAWMRLLVATGSADELPGLLDWLEWGGVALDLGAIGAGGRITAPCPAHCRPPSLAAGAPGERCPQEAAVWLRPPDAKGEVEPTLPRAGFGGDGGAPDLVRLVSTAATECHRARLVRALPLPRQRRAGEG
ncbi:SCO3374 family protein [Streptomyces indonesiensis]